MSNNSNNNFKYVFKMILIGDPFVGKSALLSSFLHGNFIDRYDVTVGVEFGAKTIQLSEYNIKLQIWDTAGQESFKSITRSYYRSSAGAIVTFDITNRTSFDNITNWFNECKINLHHFLSCIYYSPRH